MIALALLALAAVRQEAVEFSVGPSAAVKDAKVRKVIVGKSTARELQNGGRITLFVTDDAILVCEARGYVRRMSLPGLKVEAEARLPASVAAFGLSRSGLLALSPTSNELRIHDVARLDLTKTIEIRNGNILATSPAMDVAFVQGFDGMVTVDLGSGQVVRKHDPSKLHEEFKRRVKRPEGDTSYLSFANMVCSPDGRYAFSGSGALHRFAISGLDLLHEEVAPAKSFMRGFNVSADSRFVAIAGDGRSPSYLLSASDMTTKEAVIPEEYRLIALSGDAARERALGLEENLGGQTVLMTFSMRGEKLETYPLGGFPHYGVRLFPSPSGKAAGITFDSGFYWLEWP